MTRFSVFIDRAGKKMTFPCIFCGSEQGGMFGEVESERYALCPGGAPCATET